MENLARSKPFDLPVRVVQFGEGNFLRAFVDWMIDVLNEKTSFRSGVRIVQVLPKGMGGVINSQGGLYTLILRGVADGKVVESKRVVSCVKDCLNAYTDWDEVRNLFRSKDLRFCFSNTTEAGIEYKKEDYADGKVQGTFPAKAASLLRDRFDAHLPGLVFLPCELIERNGAELKRCILAYAADWGFPAAFREYVEKECVFCSTLVDRIVAGYPRAEAPRFWNELGYHDDLLDCGEPFHFFVIEGPDFLRKELPFEEAGLHVVFVPDQTPYRTRKVRFLNGAHTASVLAAYLAGFDFVADMVADPMFGKYLRTLLFDEIFRTVNLPEAEKRAFAEAVLERFANPFAMHRLLSISLNSVSKWKVRVLPSLLDYRKLEGKLPPVLTFSLAALIAFYRNRGGSGLGRINDYPVSDAPETVAFFETVWNENGTDFRTLVKKVLERKDFWGMDLTSVEGLAECVAGHLESIRRDGIRLAAEGLFA